MRKPSGESATKCKNESREQVEIRKRGKIIAGPSTKPVPSKKRPDFAARLQRIYGDTVLPGNVVVEEREFRRRVFWS